MGSNPSKSFVILSFTCDRKNKIVIHQVQQNNKTTSDELIFNIVKLIVTSNGNYFTIKLTVTSDIVNSVIVILNVIEWVRLSTLIITSVQPIYSYHVQNL